MQKLAAVSFDDVKATFLRENATTPERNDWPLGALRVANQQFGNWVSVRLAPDELLSVMLPHHAHGVNLVPPAGLSVSDAILRLDGIDRSTECYTRIQQFSDERNPSVFLSIAPIDDPGYGDYAGLVHRGYRGLTHLDGLHRLIAWGREQRPDVPAYIAGLE
jgi:hypothetical protein